MMLGRMLKNLFKMALKEKVDKVVDKIDDYVQGHPRKDYTAYQEYFTNTDGKWEVRIYSYTDLGKLLETATGKEINEEAAKAAAMEVVKKLMEKYKRV